MITWITLIKKVFKEQQLITAAEKLETAVEELKIKLQQEKQEREQAVEQLEQQGQSVMGALSRFTGGEIQKSMSWLLPKNEVQLKIELILRRSKFLNDFHRSLEKHTSNEQIMNLAASLFMTIAHDKVMQEVAQEVAQAFQGAAGASKCIQQTLGEVAEAYSPDPCAIQ